MGEPTEGWAWLDAGKSPYNWHYFIHDRRSLCGKWALLFQKVELEPDPGSRSDVCTGCRKALDRRNARVEGRAVPEPLSPNSSPCSTCAPTEPYQPVVGDRVEYGCGTVSGFGQVIAWQEWFGRGVVVLDDGSTHSFHIWQVTRA